MSSELRLKLRMGEGQDNLSELLSEVEDSLEDLGYTAVTDLKKAADDGFESQQLTDLVCFLAQEVGELAGLEDRLQETEVGSEAWIMELSSLLRELGCPHTSLTQVRTLSKVLAKLSRLTCREPCRRGWPPHGPGWCSWSSSPLS